MAKSVAFEWLCDQLETAISMTRLESRGTARLGLKAAGLDPRTVTQRELEVVIERALPGELASRNIEGGNEICEEIAHRLDTAKLMEPQAAETGERVRTARAVESPAARAPVCRVLDGAVELGLADGMRSP